MKMLQPLAGCVLKESARPRTVSVVEAGVVLAGVVVRAGVGVAGEPAGAWLRGFCCKGEVVLGPAPPHPTWSEEWLHGY